MFCAYILASVRYTQDYSIPWPWCIIQGKRDERPIVQYGYWVNWMPLVPRKVGQPITDINHKWVCASNRSKHRMEVSVFISDWHMISIHFLRSFQIPHDWCRVESGMTTKNSNLWMLTMHTSLWSMPRIDSHWPITVPGNTWCIPLSWILSNTVFSWSYAQRLSTQVRRK